MQTQLRSETMRRVEEGVDWETMEQMVHLHT